MASSPEWFCKAHWNKENYVIQEHWLLCLSCHGAVHTYMQTNAVLALVPCCKSGNSLRALKHRSATCWLKLTSLAECSSETWSAVTHASLLVAGASVLTGSTRQLALQPPESIRAVCRKQGRTWRAHLQVSLRAGHSKWVREGFTAKLVHMV